MGDGRGTRLFANFGWDSDGIPLVVVNAETPLQAIGLSVHVDKNFSVRQWVTCVSCGTGYEKQRGDGKFCSPRCKNYFTTNTRRRKIKLLRQAMSAWNEKPDKSSAGDRWAWIAQWVNKQPKDGLGLRPITPDWAKKILKQSETSRQKERKKNRDLQK
jgi:predicted nucleic acid-binding Zn ribbon protein